MLSTRRMSSGRACSCADCFRIDQRHELGSVVTILATKL